MVKHKPDQGAAILGSDKAAINDFYEHLYGLSLNARELRVILYCIRWNGYDNDHMRLCQHLVLYPHHAKDTVKKLIAANVLVANGDRYGINPDVSAWTLDSIKKTGRTA